MRYVLAWATTWVRWIPGNFDDRGAVVAGRCMAPKKMSSVIRPGACIQWNTSYKDTGASAEINSYNSTYPYVS